MKTIEIKYDNLDCYALNNQPITCGLCGTRTDFKEVSDVMQLHECLNSNCGYKFISYKD